MGQVALAEKGLVVSVSLGRLEAVPSVYTIAKVAIVITDGTRQHHLALFTCGTVAH